MWLSREMIQLQKKSIHNGMLENFSDTTFFSVEHINYSLSDLA